MAEVETTREGARSPDRAEPPGQAERIRRRDARGLQGSAEGGCRLPEVRAVVLTGSGRGFCVGQDLAELQEGERDVGALLRALESSRPHACAALSRCSPPSTAPPRVPGSRWRALRPALAADTAAFVPAFIRVGLVPDTSGSAHPELLSIRKAFEWMCSGRKIGAEEALAWGLVSEVVGADQVLAIAQGRAAELAKLSRRRRSR